MLILSVSLAAITLSLIMAILIIRSVTSALNGLSKSMKEIEAAKDFTRTTECNSHDEIGETICTFNQLITSVREALAQAKLSSDDNATIATDLISASAQIEQSAKEVSSVVSAATSDGQTVRLSLESSVNDARITKDEVDRS
ncbi:MAG: cell wall metabolism sensor histidine kinase WalK, partial [Campylobacterales bacterium]